MNVELIDHNASDLKCVNAARVSYKKSSNELTEKDKGLINAMMREHHGSVFEHCSFTFKVKAPIVVIREWQRHRIGHSYNEISARYSKIDPEFYYPESRKQSGKAMEYSYSIIDGNINDNIQEILRNSYMFSYYRYEELLDLGLAKEAARFVLPVSIYTEMFWSCNARSLMQFLSLRTTMNAMKEIRALAKKSEVIFSKIMPVTYKAFNDNGRIAP